MKLKITYIVSIIIITSCLLLFLFNKTLIKTSVPATKISTVNSKITPKGLTAIKSGFLKALAHVKKEKPVTKSEILQTVVTSNSTLKQISFEELPGWNETDIKKSLLAFQKSCATFVKQKPNHSVGSEHIKLTAKDWQPACKEALVIHEDYETQAKAFFEKWFYPVELAKKSPTRGLFTGYYMPSLKGNLTRTKEYNTPIYGMPQDLKWSSHYTRAEIDAGALQKKAPVIAWINSPVDRQFLEIEGSGVIKLTNGKNLYVTYAGENGAPFTSMGSVLIKKGVMNKHNASKTAIKRYLESKPQKGQMILQKNKSFVFFENVKKRMALGARGTALTPGYSLAIDRKWIPLGTPLWLTTKIPDQKNDNEKKFQRLMIAQDTGGAINGLMRGDIYWGAGEKATYLGEHMKNEGRYWLLLPKHAFNNLAAKFKSWRRVGHTRTHVM